jgi:hypothetical protein
LARSKFTINENGLENIDYVICQICQKKFGQITSKHLTSHQITFDDYINRFPNAQTKSQVMQTRKSKNISIAKTGCVAHNKGKSASEEQKKKQSIVMKEKFLSGEIIHWNLGNTTSEETKEKIRNSLIGKSYWSEHANRKRNQTIAEKVKNGWVSPLKGRPISSEIKQKIKSSLSLKISENKKIYFNKLENIAKNKNLRILSHVNYYYLTFECLSCQNIFTFTKQILRQSNKKTDTACPTCFPRLNGTSNKENELYEYIKSVYSNSILKNDRCQLSGKEIDIFIPDLKIGFEFDGLYWHSEANKDKNEMLNKKLFALKNGIKIYNIYEDEWDNHPEIVKDRIRHILGISSPNTVYARKCIIKEIDSKTKKQFLQENHIQGNDTSTIANLGAFYLDELVGVMTFKPTSFVKGGDGSEIELSRFAIKINYAIPGIASKLLKFYTQKHSPNSIISYADNRWSFGNLYKKIGFDFVHRSEPSYWYINSNDINRYHRSRFMKHILVEKYDADPSMTEHEIMNEMGFLRVYDAGTTKWRLILNS